ncbi:DUF5074 domain-containing protein [Jiulongibacter sp. NS-SX5]|uniref:DUF5074 domain-containing protein n=1 Tax=Jiulongibacter sp. NS-SX5 TaxID=3463854 RepID=UPI0040586A41
MKIRFLLITFLTAGILASCDNSKNDPEPEEPIEPYDLGVIVINAGNFTDNNGTLSLISRSNQTASYDIFQKENLRSISGGISGYAEAKDKGIILVDNSTAGQDLIEIVDAGTFKSVATIPSSEIENPRNVIPVSDTKAYITAWDATGDFSNFYANPGYVAVLDLTSNQIIKKIEVQNGAETLVKVGDDVFVGNTGSGQTIVSVIDVNTDALNTTIEVGANPSIIGEDASGKLWIYAGGQLQKINPSSKSVESTMSITSSNAEMSPSSFVMSADKNTVYYTMSFYDAADNWIQKGETFSFNTSASTVEATTPFIDRLFGGGFGVDSETGYLYAGLIPSYKQAGYVFRYMPNGTLVDSVKAEIAPSKFYFKK